MGKELWEPECPARHRGDPQESLAGVTSATDLRLYLKHRGGDVLQSDLDTLLFGVSRADRQPAPADSSERTDSRRTTAQHWSAEYEAMAFVLANDTRVCGPVKLFLGSLVRGD